MPQVEGMTSEVPEVTGVCGDLRDKSQKQMDPEQGRAWCETGLERWL